MFVIQAQSTALLQNPHCLASSSWREGFPFDESETPSSVLSEPSSTAEKIVANVVRILLGLGS
jgi:hypothetical protein